jgi:aminopeptidase N
MRWWNGLWLNESFATFMAAEAVDQATDFNGSWQAFHGEKEWAYWEDQLVTTHPIEVPVLDTDFAQSNFDGITYGKGASVLKQLSYFLGDDEFNDGIQRYFKEFALRNTTIHDFMRKLSEAGGTDLSKWQKSWVQTAGVNTVRVDWACGEPKDSNSSDSDDENAGRKIITQFNVVQLPSEFNPELRIHRSEVRLYSAEAPKKRKHRAPETKSSAKKPADLLSISYSAAETPVKEALGKACPDFVFPNNRDFDYVKVELDPVSLAYVSKNLASIDDSLLREMIWDSLWEMVVDGKLKAADYAEIILSQAAEEKNTLTLSRVLKPLTALTVETPSIIRFAGPALAPALSTKIEAFTHQRLLAQAGGSDLQLVWFEAFLETAHSKEALEYIDELLKDKAHLKGLKLDQEKRWKLVASLARSNFTGAADLIALELKADPTDMGQKEAISAEASIPDPASKKKWLDLIIAQKKDSPIKDPNNLGVAKLRSAMENLQLIGQEDLIRQSVDPYFSRLEQMASQSTEEDEEFTHDFTEAMFPSLCDQAIVDRTAALLKAHPDLPAPLLKTLRIKKQEEERCIRARAKSAG